MLTGQRRKERKKKRKKPDLGLVYRVAAQLKTKKVLCFSNLYCVKKIIHQHWWSKRSAKSRELHFWVDQLKLHLVRDSCINFCWHRLYPLPRGGHWCLCIISTLLFVVTLLVISRFSWPELIFYCLFVLLLNWNWILLNKSKTSKQKTTITDKCRFPIRKRLKAAGWMGGHSFM